ncbi:hypothetical protein CLV98_103231 [Dyadobacter jejuensis]|uniref:Uncharacterized protein n=1 Tax=Dyadobacter jejuensis TaxID=1082580 RepID=A0A316ANZ5_9BACT|nr:hypothetical protein CLV98_103231 [Dyadobacter jejuensis]
MRHESRTLLASSSSSNITFYIDLYTRICDMFIAYLVLDWGTLSASRCRTIKLIGRGMFFVERARPQTAYCGVLHISGPS